MPTLYVVDDDSIYLFILKKMMIRYKPDWTTRFSSSSWEIWTDIKKFKDNASLLPDIIFIDLNMPVMSGLEFLDNLKALYPSLAKAIRVIVFTSNPSPASILNKYWFNVFTKCFYNHKERQRLFAIKI